MRHSPAADRFLNLMEIADQESDSADRASDLIAAAYTYLTVAHRLVPSALHVVDQSTDSGLGWRICRDMASAGRFSIASPEQFVEVVDKHTGDIEGPNLFNNLGRLTKIDFGVSGADVSSVAAGTELRCTFHSTSPVSIPLEIGVVLAVGDTLFDTVSVSPTRKETSSVTYSIILSHRPQAIIVDPRHQLPDIDRSNNYYFFLPRRFRYQEPETIYPGYRIIG
jgi:hypothetical protein